MKEKQFELVCMAYDGATVRDSIGTLKECRDRIENIGSKWIFYPWPIIVTIKGKIIIEMCGQYHNIVTGNSIINQMFKRRKLSTVQNAFKRFYDLNNAIDSTDDYEWNFIMLNSKFDR